MKAPKATDVKRGISVIRENLQCPICLDLLSMPISTKCDHQFCRFCMMKLLDRKKEANCPVCKSKVTKRSLQESPGFQRLVEGLQHMVQAYEEDTSTDYFTGASQGLEHLRCQEGGPREMQYDGGKTLSCDSQGVDSADSSRSPGPEEARISFSSAEAQQGYAKLMDLEDSCAITLDKEGFDSGLSDMPQASEMLTDDKCTASTTNLELPGSSVEVTIPLGAEMIKLRTKKDKSHNVSHEQRESPEEVPKKTGRRPHRATTKMVDADPEKIVDRRCRRSLQKVSEWLLKISPTDVEEDGDSCLSDGGSSSSTIKEEKDKEPPLTIRKDDHNKSLEEQVFGVVYRRDRKSMGNRLNRTLLSESRGVTALSACHPSDGIQIQKIASNRGTSSGLAPADKMPHTEEEEGEVHVVSQSVCNESNVEPIKGQTSEDRPNEEVDLLELCSDSYKKNIEQVQLPEGEDVAEDSPVFEVSLRRTSKRARSNVGSTWKEVDNLRQDGNGETGNVKQGKRKSECRKKENWLTQMRSAKVAKPLDLVSNGVDTYDPTVRLQNGQLIVKTEVQIESYPSSEGLGSPAARITRQSKRLQVFTKEVQGTKRNTRSAGSTKSAVPHFDKAYAGEKAAFEEIVVRAQSPKTKMMENSMMRIGCIVDGDLANIEKIESSISKAVDVQNEWKESPTKKSGSLSAITNAESSSDVNIQYSALKGVQPASQASQDHSQEDVLEIHSSVENSVCKVIQVHGEEDEKNDSEQDTEQLLKTFKATKRRSFQLGVPKPISSDRASTFCDKENEEAAPEVVFINEELNPNRDLEPCCLMETVKEAEVQQNQESVGMPSPSISKKNEVENSLCSDLVPPTNGSNHSLHNSLLLKKSYILTGENSNELFEESSNTGKGPEARPTGNSGNGAPPTGRKRKNSETSSRLSVSSQIMDSELLFPALVASEEVPKESASAIDNMPLGEVESQKPLNSTSEDSENSGVFKKRMIGSACHEGVVFIDSTADPHGFHDRHQAIMLQNSETDKVLQSSMTPDDLLPPIVVLSTTTECTVSAGPSQRAGNVEDTAQWSSEGDPRLRKRKRPQRLESSGSEGSDEEVQLPSLAQLFGQDKSKQPVEEKTIPVIGDLPPCNGQTSTEHSLKRAPSPEWVQASQGSVDLFDTPEQCEGLPDDRGHSVESTQFSNEIIGTQQKVAMQAELRRLEEMMALVSEALHKKADGSQLQVKTSQGSLQNPGSAAQRAQDHPQSPPWCDRTGEAPTRRESLPPSTLSQVSCPGGRTLRSGRGFISPLPAPRATPAPQPPTRKKGASRQSVVKKFSKQTGCSLSAQVTLETTHVVIRTDENLVCERTLKYFMGIAARKWVVSFQWIVECFNHGKVLNEAAFEVRGDVVNGQRHQGPMKARTTGDQELLMSGYEVCLQGSFTDMTTGQMEWMVELCGGRVVKDPLLFSGKQKSTQLVVVQPDSEESQAGYRALQKRAAVVSRGWLLDSVATYTLQNANEYRLGCAPVPTFPHS